MSNVIWSTLAVAAILATFVALIVGVVIGIRMLEKALGRPPRREVS